MGSVPGAPPRRQWGRRPPGRDHRIRFAGRCVSAATTTSPAGHDARRAAGLKGRNDVGLFSRGKSKDRPDTGAVDADLTDDLDQDELADELGRRRWTPTPAPGGTTGPARPLRGRRRQRLPQPRRHLAARAAGHGAAPRGQRAGAADHGRDRRHRRVGGAAAGLRRAAHRGRLDRHPQRDRREHRRLPAAPPRSSPASSARSC